MSIDVCLLSPRGPGLLRPSVGAWPAPGRPSARAGAVAPFGRRLAGPRLLNFLNLFWMFPWLRVLFSSQFLVHHGLATPPTL